MTNKQKANEVIGMAEDRELRDKSKEWSYPVDSVIAAGDYEGSVTLAAPVTAYIDYLEGRVRELEAELKALKGAVDALEAELQRLREENEKLKPALIYLRDHTEGEARAYVEVMSTRLGFGHAIDIEPLPTTPSDGGSK